MKCACCDKEIGLEENQGAFLVDGIRFGVHYWHLFELVGEDGAAAIEALVASQKRKRPDARRPLRVVRRSDGGSSD
jgi:hypothetical protein